MKKPTALLLLSVLLALIGGPARSARADESISMAVASYHACSCTHHHAFGEIPTCPPCPPMRWGKLSVRRSVAMKLTGHMTESVYRRYAIVSEIDLADALRKLAAFQGGSGKA